MNIGGAMGKQSVRARWPVQISKSGRQLSPASIERAEMELGVTFPQEYREFMLAHNGGEPDPSFFVLKRRKTADLMWVQMLCPITSSRIDSLNLRGQNEKVAEYAEAGDPVPPGCFAIGYTGAGDNLLLFTSGRRKGQVWLKVWDELDASEGSQNDPEDAMYRLATSFKGFLRTLCTEEEASRRVG
jgi:hypothetical protein